MDAHLFTPFTTRSLTLRNRIVVSPMCMYSADDGLANDWHLVHLGARAAGGAGAIISEAAAVEPRGRISPQDLGIWSDEHIPGLARIARFVKGQGCAIGIQLAHAGRKAGTRRPWEGGGQLSLADGGWETVGPSADPFRPEERPPAALSEAGVHEVIQSFAQGARRAVEAGFDFVEIHAAHGYLLHQFLSPLSNTRQDDWGGSLANRARLLLEVLAEVRRQAPDDLPVWVRFSCTDWADGGWDIEEILRLAPALRDAGVDLIDCSSGGASPAALPPSAGPGYQVLFSRRIRAHAGLPTGAVGLITSPEQADTIIRTGQADLILLGRESLRRAEWPIEAARRLRQEPPVPPQYLRAWPRS